MIDSPSPSSDHDCYVIEDIAPPVSSQPVETSCSNTTTQFPHTPMKHSVNTPVPLFSVDHMVQSNHMIQSNGIPPSEAHMISSSEDQVMSKHQPQCSGLQMLSQYDSDDSELEPGEVV